MAAKADRIGAEQVREREPLEVESFKETVDCRTIACS